MKVPFLNLRWQQQQIHEQAQPGIAAVLEKANFILGEEVVTFENQFAQYCGTRHAIGVASGLDALKIGLRALGVGAGDEVITAANTFIATVLAITLIGAVPVLIDPDPKTYNLDPEGLRRAITLRTKAIIPVHLYGQPAAMAPLRVLAEESSIPILEDAAQAHGARYQGVRAGCLGQVAAFSFYPGKNLGAAGDAGMITTNDDAIADSCRSIRNYGSRVKYYHTELGENSRLDTLQAVILNAKLAHLDDWNAMRRQIARQYDAGLTGVGDLVLPTTDPDAEHVYHLYVVQTARRDALMQSLKETGVDCIIHYPVAIHRQECYHDRGWVAGDFPISEALSERVISLPIYPGMSVEEAGFVISSVRAFFEKRT